MNQVLMITVMMIVLSVLLEGWAFLKIRKAKLLSEESAGHISQLKGHIAKLRANVAELNADKINRKPDDHPLDAALDVLQSGAEGASANTLRQYAETLEAHEEAQSEAAQLTDSAGSLTVVGAVLAGMAAILGLLAGFS